MFDNKLSEKFFMHDMTILVGKNETLVCTGSVVKSDYRGITVIENYVIYEKTG